MFASKRRPLWSMAIVALLAVTTTAATIDPRLLFSKDGVCGRDVNLQPCAESGLPDGFCCGKSDTCLVLAGRTTVLCCPQGSTCATINPIVCDLRLQDPIQNPAAAVKTTLLNGKLDTCGAGCCPYGYSCDNGACKQNTDQSQPPAGANPAPSSSRPGGPTATVTTQTSTPTTTLQITASASATVPAGAATTTPQPTDNTDVENAGGTPVGAIIGGVVAAVLAVAAAIWLIIFLRRRKNKETELKHYDTSSSFGNIVVSAPQPIKGYPNMRQDFLAKTSSRGSMVSSTLVSPRLGSSGSGRPSPKFSQPYSYRMSDELSQSDARSHHHSAEIRALRNLTRDPFVNPPRTPENKGRQESGGSASIDIYVEEPSTTGSSSGKKTKLTTARPPRDVAPPSGAFLGAALGVPGQRDTTWSNILHGAGGFPETPTKRKN
ncbi:cell wall integrity and stress response component [Microdochium nivale]|nr:cell wall integrity and stress response component [Microdochium nivale]